MGTFILEFSQRPVNIGDGVFNCRVGKKQGYIPADKTAGGQGRACRTGFGTIVFDSRNEWYFRGIGAFNPIRHSSLDAGPDSRPLPGEGV